MKSRFGCDAGKVSMSASTLLPVWESVAEEGEFFETNEDIAVDPSGGSLVAIWQRYTESKCMSSSKAASLR